MRPPTVTGLNELHVMLNVCIALCITAAQEITVEAAFMVKKSNLNRLRYTDKLAQKRHRNEIKC
jgi:hypothetical protein